MTEDYILSRKEKLNILLIIKPRFSKKKVIVILIGHLVLLK